MITNPMQMLLALRAKRGGRFDRAAAMVVLHKAQQHFGDDAGRVVTAWCQYAAGNSAITNAPGFVRYKVESGEWPPENDDERQAGSYVDRLPEDIRRLIQR